MIIYLYKKTHNITKLMYLGKTTKDPFKYKGSGTDWKLHLTEHGKDHSTEIIKVCQTPSELTYWGRYYSKLWNVVGAMDNFGNKMWANRIPETGGGNGSGHKGKSLSNNHKTKIAASMKKVWDSIYDKKTMSEKFKQAQSNPVLKQHLSTVRSKIANAPGAKQNRSNNTKVSWTNPQTRNSRVASLKKSGSSSAFKHKMSKVTSGNKNASFDHQLYNWEHITGITEYSTRYDLEKKYNLSKVMLCRLVSGNAKLHKGWKLIKANSQ